MAGGEIGHRFNHPALDYSLRLRPLLYRVALFLHPNDRPPMALRPKYKRNGLADCMGEFGAASGVFVVWLAVVCCLEEGIIRQEELKAQALEKTMNRVTDLEKAVKELTEQEYCEFRKRFLERDWEMWDRQIEADSNSGKLDFLVREAFEAKKRGDLREL